MKQTLSTLAVAIAGGAAAVVGYTQLVDSPQQVVIQQNQTPSVIRTANGAPIQWDSFSEAAEMAVNSVVHVKTAVEQGYYVSPFRGFGFGQGNMTPRIVEGTGSGVIISENGYIVTNNHVIANAQSVEVMLNDNREYEAEVIGTDPTTDIAVLKIAAEGLQPLTIANSDDLRLGQWVLAVGNPFNLNSTVTAGIVSAKGRSINIIDEQSAIESFIQTDAAVNPGNSGGALVNLNGDLVGINTAISTHTGSFEGYSFAVPSNLARKVVDDIIEYGQVQRAYLGVNITNVTPELSEQFDLDLNTGVYIADVVEGSAAEDAGLERGDVITQINNRPVTRTSELLEVIGSKRPGDAVQVTVDRGGNSRSLNLTLTNSSGNTDLVRAEPETGNELGGTFRGLSEADKRQLKLRNGVVVTDPGTGELAKAGVPRGFVITKVNNQRVDSEEDILAVVAEIKPGDGLLIQGYHPNGKPDFFAFGM
ncbi:trypsin-like peptidase domain-containing protein [Phaeocystidibacter luteus]|uniref:PDZ domain-containing protein n=1 Tax=Phaeocystidibacter luteus TaxID=911197 RepID=A0A6N6RM82_9FLAO|nr:trypsin-like peptidase domain-containing protein [Phaeocystidibacter luteus]KAB2814679.1 PDZ domain-containing protein [Phaeocystidibacter luteus]